jgi:hypothetical protein
MKAVEIAGRAGGSAAKACIAEIQEDRRTGVQEYRSSESEISDFARRLFRGLSTG